MKKDIYLIKNDINNKLYVGQSVNAKDRFYKHKNESKSKADNMLIHRAMRKYGFEHFSYEILEEQVENYDEREIYWIAKLNTQVPNGYNIAMGGDSVGLGIYHVSAKIKDLETLEQLYNDLINSTDTFGVIGQRYGLSDGEVCDINQGKYYHNDELTYPLRPLRGYDEDTLKRLTYSMKYELDKSFQDLAKEYNIDFSQISLINQGKIYFREYLTYPIRISKEVRIERLVDDIIRELQFGTLPQKEIARKYNIAQSTVVAINIGQKHRKNGLKYPLRAHYQNPNYKTISNDVLYQIMDDIKHTNLTMRAIGAKYEIDARIICGINSGSIKKYRLEQCKYPIRKKT